MEFPDRAYRSPRSGPRFRECVGSFPTDRSAAAHAHPALPTRWGRCTRSALSAERQTSTAVKTSASEFSLNTDGGHHHLHYQSTRLGNRQIMKLGHFLVPPGIDLESKRRGSGKNARDQKEGPGPGPGSTFPAGGNDGGAGGGFVGGKETGC